MLQMTTLPDDGARPGLEKGVTGRSDEALGLGNDADGRTADALSASDDGPCPGPQHSQMMALVLAQASDEQQMTALVLVGDWALSTQQNLMRSFELTALPKRMAW